MMGENTIQDAKCSTPSLPLGKRLPSQLRDANAKRRESTTTCSAWAHEECRSRPTQSAALEISPLSISSTNQGFQAAEGFLEGAARKRIRPGAAATRSELEYSSGPPGVTR